MAAGDPHGDLIMRTSSVPINLSSTASVTVGFSTKRVTGRGHINYFYAWREHKYNDPILHITPYPVGTDDSSTTGGASLRSEDELSDWGGDNYNLVTFNYYAWVKEFNFTRIFGLIIGDNRKLWDFGAWAGKYYYFSPSGNDKRFTTNGDLTQTNYDEPWDPNDAYNDWDCVNNMTLNVGQQLVFHISDSGAFNSTPWKANVTKDVTVEIQYPPYRKFPSFQGEWDFGENNGGGSGSNGGGKDIEGSHETLEAIQGFIISRAGDTQNFIGWNKSSATGDYHEPITTMVTVDGNITDQTGNKEYMFTTPNKIAYTYDAMVKRYYTNYPDIMVYSNKLLYYTYSKPTLTGITLSKYTISPRSGENIRVSLTDMNNRTFSVENNFRTGIWSTYKGQYYIDEVSVNNFRDIPVSDIRILFPDTSAKDGTTTGTIYANRRNTGVPNGRPSSSDIVYQTSVFSKNITVQYKPTSKIDVNNTPSNNEGSSGLVYYKNEKGVQGTQLPAGQTWVLPNTYDISDMTGVNVKIQYPKTDSSGVLSGYRIRLLLPNDGTHANDYVWYETYWYTQAYTYTGTIPYDKLKRGISGNRIRITPFYIPSNVAKENTSGYWYGTEVEKKFVDIAWMLNDPVIDCPLNNTTWHNHQYRILFKLPVDNDTKYGSVNDIQNHYGNGNYRYQEIELKINGVTTVLGNNAYMNAQNSWNSPTNITNAKLTYQRAIIINPTLISTYKDASSFSISIRVRKAYGQNSNWDGWSNWSKTINVNRKTVSNASVARHQTIMASHYMNVQNALNSSLGCYAKTASDNKAFIVKESFDRARGDNINGPHKSPPQNTPLGKIKEYVSEFNDLHQLKNKINAWGTFDTDKNRNAVKLDNANNLLGTFTPSQEFITAAKDQNGATENTKDLPVLKGRNYMKYMCDELNHLY